MRLGLVRAVRDAWLVVGATIVLILALESGYRLQGLVRRSITARLQSTPATEPPSPFDSTSWAAEYLLEKSAIEAVRWAPYVYRRHPSFQGRFISTDSLGHRITPQRMTSKGGRTIRIFFFGGSTTFGWYQRDGNTIPAIAADRLENAPGEDVGVEVTNLGVAGHTFTQEVIELILRLREGERPDVVVFYDGINDVMSTEQNGRAGFPQNEANREVDFLRGRRLAAESRPGFGNDLLAIGHGLQVVLSRSELARRILASRPPISAMTVSTDTLAQRIVDMYTANVRIVETLAAGYGFEPIYAWQPALLSTRKRLTPRESWLGHPQRISDLHRAVPELLEPAMTPLVGPRFVNATDRFDDDSLDIFVDVFGHTLERANPLIVDALMPSLSAAVAVRRTRFATRGKVDPRPH